MSDLVFGLESPKIQANAVEKRLPEAELSWPLRCFAHQRGRPLPAVEGYILHYCAFLEEYIHSCMPEISEMRRKH